MLQWDVEIYQNVLYLRAWDCSGVSEGNQVACQACRSLPDDSKLQGILDWLVKGTTPSTLHQYWSWGVLQSNLLQICKRLETKELLLFNNYVKLGRQTCVIDDHKCLMMITVYHLEMLRMLMQ